MDARIKALVDRVASEARRGAMQDKETIVELLELEPGSEEAEYLREEARRFALEVSGGRARIAGAIGIDLHPCEMNCKFCSFGAEWGLVKEESILTKGQVLEMAREYVENGVNMVTLRSTEFYDLNTINEWIREIRLTVPGEYELNLNVGELTAEMCQACYEAGASSAYHVLRMGEGIDTPFDPEIRKRTIKTISESPLKLNTCIEPIGVEHTSEQVADAMVFALSMRPHSLGIMPRVPVKGTPLGDAPQLGRERMRQMLAVLRLCAGSTVPYVTMHPDDVYGLEAGSNGFAVERGAVPRDTGYSDGEWRGLTAVKAVGILKDAGYVNRLIECDPRFREGAGWWRPAPLVQVQNPAVIGEDGVEYLCTCGSRTPLKK